MGNIGCGLEGRGRLQDAESLEGDALQSYFMAR